MKKPTEALEPIEATELLRRLISCPETKFNRVNRAQSGGEDEFYFSQSDLIQACRHGRVVGTDGFSSRQTFPKYIVRSRSLQYSGRFIEVVILMDAEKFIIKILSFNLV
jgi:hypothetical protein